MSTAVSPRPQAFKLSTGRVIGYGLGDFAFNLSFTFCSLFLLYFYTDVLELSPSTAGLIIMAALIWEGLTDPIVGFITNRTRSRWGRYRPYLLLGSVPLALVFVLMFAPVGLTGTALTAYAFATHLLFRTVYTFVNIPYIALSAELTRDSLVRGQLAGSRMIFAILCGLFLAAMSLPLVARFGGGHEGYFRVAALYAFAATLILLVCFRVTREQSGSAEPQPSLRQMMDGVRRNRPFLLLLGGTLLGSVAYTMSGKAMLYYMKYYAGSESAVTIGLTVSLSASAVAMIPWLFVARRASKRLVWLAGALISSTAAVSIYILQPKVGALLWLLLGINGIGNAALLLAFWSMLPDTVEYGEWRTGIRSEGAIFGLVLFTQKVAFGVGTGLIGVVLGWMGYIANQAQTAEALHGIILMYTIVPMVLALAGAALILWYPLDVRTHARLVRALEWRRERGQSSVVPRASI